MNKNPFFSNKVSFKGILKGLAISIPCLIMILVIGSYFSDLMGLSVSQETDVLGVESDPKMIGTYEIEANEYVYRYDWKYDGYMKLDAFINKPQYYFAENKVALTDSWFLKNKYKLEMSCPELEIDKAIPGDSYVCTLKYNNNVVREDIRYDIYNFNDLESITGNIDFVVYSDVFSDYEYLVTGKYAGGSHDLVTVYRLENGKAALLSFYDGKEDSNEWYVTSPMIFEMYEDTEDNGKLKMITYFHEPSMGGDNNLVGLYDVWNMNDNKLVKEKTIGDLMND